MPQGPSLTSKTLVLDGRQKAVVGSRRTAAESMTVVKVGVPIRAASQAADCLVRPRARSMPKLKEFSGFRPCLGCGGPRFQHLLEHELWHRPREQEALLQRAAPADQELRLF